MFKVGGSSSCRLGLVFLSQINLSPSLAVFKEKRGFARPWKHAPIKTKAKKKFAGVIRKLKESRVGALLSFLRSEDLSYWALNILEGRPL